MLQEKMAQGITYHVFMEEQNSQDKQKRGQSIRLSSHTVERIRKLKPKYILVYGSITSPESLLVVQILQKMQEVNQALQYRIIQETEKVQEIQEFTGVPLLTLPTVFFFDKEEQLIETWCGRSQDFNRRIKGLDQEDTEELIRHYRQGKYNRQLMDEFISICEK